MMKKPINYFWPVVTFLFGFTIMLSPTGRVPRMGYEFYEYKYVAGFSFVAICFLLLMNLREK